MSDKPSSFVPLTRKPKTFVPYAKVDFPSTDHPEIPMLENERIAGENLSDASDENPMPWGPYTDMLGAQLIPASLPRAEPFSKLIGPNVAPNQQSSPIADVYNAVVPAAYNVGVKGSLDFLNTPGGLMSLGAGYLPSLGKRALALYFGAEMAKGSAESFHKAQETGEPQDYAESALQALPALGLIHHGIAKGAPPVRPSLQEIAAKSGYTIKEWPVDPDFPQSPLAGTSSFTDPKTGTTIENIRPGVSPADVAARMQEKANLDATKVNPTAQVPPVETPAGVPPPVEEAAVPSVAEAPKAPVTETGLDAQIELDLKGKGFTADEIKAMSPKEVYDARLAGPKRENEYALVHTLRNISQSLKAGKQTGKIPEAEALDFQLAAEDIFARADEPGVHTEAGDLLKEVQDMARGNVRAKNNTAESGAGGSIESRGPQGGNISSLGFLDPGFWKNLGFSGKVDAQQIANRARNKLGETSSARHVARKDLIFKNPDGTPKTDVSGFIYPIERARADFTYTGKDKAPTAASIGEGVRGAIEGRGPQGGNISALGFLDPAAWKSYFGFGPHDAKLKSAADALPDFMSKTDANREHSIKFASEKIPGLGRLMGGKARIETPQDQAVAAWYAERHGAGPALASALGEQIRGIVNPVFKADKSGDLNVKLNNPQASRKISDVFEGLQSGSGDYLLTPEQTKVWTDVLDPLLKEMSKLTKKYDLTTVTDEHVNFEPYFPRVVTKLPRPGRPGTTGNRVGAKQFFQKERLYDTEREGWQEGVEYSNEVEARLIKGVERLYRAIADKRLATDPILGGRTRAQLYSDLKVAYGNAKTPNQIRKIANSVQQQGSVYSPAFFGRIFERDTAAMLNKEFSAEQHVARKAVASVNSTMKAIKLGFDFGSGQIQLLPTLFSNPVVWAKTQAKSMASFANPQVFAEYVRSNQEVIREMNQYGSSVGRLQEQMAGLSKEEVLPRALGKIPVVGKALQQVPLAFGRQFQTSLDFAKVELYKAWRDVTPVAERGNVIRAIESQLLSGRMESAMVTHSRSLNERVLTLAPSYYRGAVDFIGALGERGVSGKIARQAMGKFLLGSVALYYGIAKQQGMTDEEIAERMDPRRSDFLMWKVKDGNKTINVGFGGIYRSLLRLAGNTVKTSVEHPGNWASLSPEKNPLTKWYRGHAGPGVNLVWNLFSGKDFLGKQADVGSETKSAVTPLALQEGGRVEKASSMVGLSAFEAPRTMKDTAKGLYPGKAFESLRLGERAKVQKALKAEGEPPSAEDQRRIMERATEKDLQRRSDLEAALPKGQQNWLKDQKLLLRSYEETLHYNRVDLGLTEEEKKFVGAEVQKEYQRVISGLMESETFKAKSPLHKQQRLDDLLSLARRRARTSLRRSVSSHIQHTPQE